LKSITTTAPSLNVGTIGSGVNPNKSLAPQIARGALSSQFTDVTNKINYYKATTQIKSKAVQSTLIVPFLNLFPLSSGVKTSASLKPQFAL